MADNNPVTATPTPSPSVNQPTGSNDVKNLGDPSAQEPPVEQTEWEKLQGKSQDRFSQMFHRAKEAETSSVALQQRLRQAEEDLQRLSNVPTYQPPGNIDPAKAEVERAIKTLKQERFTQTDDVEKIVEDRVNQATRNLLLQQEHDRLRDKYSRLNRKDSRYPAYDPEIIEDFGRKNNIFNLQVAYNEMYRDELMDIEAGRSTQNPRQPISTRPSNAAVANPSNEPLSLDEFRKKLKGPDGKKWYDEQVSKNPEAFQALVNSLANPPESV